MRWLLWLGGFCRVIGLKLRDGWGLRSGGEVWMRLFMEF